MGTRVDSHCHLWSLKRGDYGWLDPANENLAPIARDFTTDDLSVQLNAHDIGQAVLVQAAPTIAETDYLLDLATQTDAVVGVVGWIDVSDPASIAILNNWSANPTLKGVRPMLQDIAQDDWIATAPHKDVVNTLQSLGLRFDALVLTQHLPHLLKFTKTYPDLPIVIDHCAKPPLRDGMDTALGMAWRDGMQRLAHETNAYCKVSGLLTELADTQLPNAEDILSPLIADLFDWFGPDRLMWGSDWPVLTLAQTFSGWVDLSTRLLSKRPQADLDAIYSGTARTFYGLEAA